MWFWEQAVTFVAAAGGAAAVFTGIVGWAGKLLLDRAAEAIKQAVEMEFAARKQLLSLSSEIDLDMRKRRLECYPELWKATEVLPRWPRAGGITYENLKSLQKNLKHWYFNKGGMFLSETTFKTAYVPLQEALAEEIADDRTGRLPKERYDEIYERIRERCSALRSGMVNDIESRRESPIK